MTILQATKQDRYITIIKIAVALVFNAIFFVIVIKNNPCIFQANDDLIMRDIASGAFSGTPDGHLIFMKYILGSFIAFLYTLSTAVSWYTLVFYGLMYFGLTTIFARLLISGKNLKEVIVACVLYAFLLLFLYKFFITIQFTVLAAILGSAGMLIFILQKQETSKKRLILEGILCVFFLFMCYLVRYEVFMMFIVPCAILLFLRLLKNKKTYIKRAIIYVCALLILLGASTVVDAFAYKGYDEYFEFNKARAKVYDYIEIPDYNKHKELYDNLGLSEAEYENFALYALETGDTYDANKLMGILEYNKSLTNLPFNVKIVNAFNIFFAAISNSMYLYNNVLMLLAFLGILIASLIFTKNYKALIAVIIVNLAIFALGIVLSIEGRLVERVLASLFLSAFIVNIGVFLRYITLLIEKMNTQKKSLRRIVIIALCGLLTFIFIRCTIAVQYYNGAELYMLTNRVKTREQLHEYFTSRSENLYYCGTHVLSTVTDRVIMGNNSTLINNAYIGGWITHFPLQYERLEKLGMYKDFALGLVSQPNAYYVGTDKEAKSLNSYIEEKYSKSLVKIDTIKVFDDVGEEFATFGVYKVN